MRCDALFTVLISLSALSSWGCEEPVECLIDSACEEGLVCVNTRCVGTGLDVNAESWALYQSEIHNRLAADCGICHGVRGEGTPVTYGQTPLDPEDVPPKLSAKDLIPLPVQTGDSGWRIYLDNLTQERLFASYLDSLQFINQHAPERSLLLAFGRGELMVNGSESQDTIIPHPKVYDIPQVGEPEPPGCTLAFADVEREAPLSPADPNQDPPLPPPTPSQVSHQRILGWAGLDHSEYGGTWPFTLASYRAHVEEPINSFCGGCHGMEDIPAKVQEIEEKLAEDLQDPDNMKTPEELEEAAAEQIEALKQSAQTKRGGFCFPKESKAKADVQIWASMINISNPSASALVHFLNGDFDHAKYVNSNGYESNKEKLESAIIKWINDER